MCRVHVHHGTVVLLLVYPNDPTVAFAGSVMLVSTPISDDMPLKPPGLCLTAKCPSRMPETGSGSDVNMSSAQSVLHRE